MHTFESWLAELSKKQIDFILIGGLAVDLCGFARNTEHMDILVSSEQDNVRKLLDALSGFGEGSGAQLTLDDFAPEEGCLRVNEDFPLDIFTQVNTKRYQDCLPLARTHAIANRTIHYLGPQALIELKSGSRRPKDEIDVQALREILERESRE